MIASLTFDSTQAKLVVVYEDGSSAEYTDAQAYLAAHPDRAADCVAMGWLEVPNA